MLKKTNNNLEEKNLSLKEINKCIDISIDNLKQILEIKNRKYIYIDELREQNVNELYNSFNNNEVETKIMSEKMKKNVNNLLSKLDLRSKEVIKLRYGINSENKEHSLSEISKKLNLSRERIRQLQIKALRKMHFSAVRNNITM
jgi:RNA polymerase sigma factor (sigma-70 family)